MLTNTVKIGWNKYIRYMIAICVQLNSISGVIFYTFLNQESLKIFFTAFDKTQ